MENNQKIKGVMNDCVTRYGDSIHTNLREGDRVRKVSGQTNSYFRVDEVSFDYLFPEGIGSDKPIIPYRGVYRHFSNRDNPEKEIEKVFGTNEDVPFSQIVQEGRGECLEKSLMLQLALQSRGIDSFLVNGVMESNEGAFLHAYNIVFVNGKPLLVDVQNPRYVGSEGEISPYAIEVQDIDQTGRIFLDESKSLGRTYCLF